MLCAVTCFVALVTQVGDCEVLGDLVDSLKDVTPTNSSL